MILINEGISQKLLDAVATGAQNSDAFSLPTKATQLTWQTLFGVAPASVTVQLQTSLDNSLWSTIDTSTSVAGEDRTIATSALFIRARINAISGGSAITVQLVCKTGFIGLTTPSSVTDGAIALFDGTTGSKLKELLFPGGTTTFLRADGTFASAGGGSGTPASPVNSIQFNNAGSFGGSANLTWDGTQFLAGVATGGTSVWNFEFKDSTPDPLTWLNDLETIVTAIGNSHDNYGVFNTGTAIQATIAPSGNDPDNNIYSAAFIQAITPATSLHSMSECYGLIVNNSFDGVSGSIQGGAIISVYNGTAVNRLLGIDIEAHGFAANAIALAGIQNTVTQHLGNVPSIFGLGNYINVYNGNTIGNVYEIYNGPVSTPDPGITNWFGFWSASRASFATNPYYLWFDSQGVYRIREDNTFNSVGQAIASLYNPQFAKYVAGATDFERIVQQWESNVAVIRTEKGGSGTVRDINIAGAHIQHNGNIGIAASITSAGLVGKTMTFVDGILTGFA